MLHCLSIWDMAFFGAIFFIAIAAWCMHFSHAMHNIRRRGSVGANYWGNYTTSNNGKGEGTFTLPKPSNNVATTVSGKAQPGCGARR